MPVHRRKKITINILIPFTVFVLFFSIMIWQKYRSSQEVPVTPPQSSTESIRSVTLFFVADGTRLVREARELDSCDADTACVKSVLDELLNGPLSSEFEKAIPEGVIVTSVRLEGSLATIRFNSLFFEAMLSGSSAEMLAVYSVVNTIAVNFPQIQKVKLEIDGNETGMLRHLDLSEPLMPDYSLELSAPIASEKKSTKENTSRKDEH
ncbi:MAG: GerMN domain-containing protein [Desulfuromonadaceae bacterium]|nr:GerMN domain-containing protein [Desulfuromonadaceae bacterium]